MKLSYANNKDVTQKWIEHAFLDPLLYMILFNSNFISGNAIESGGVVVTNIC